VHALLPWWRHGSQVCQDAPGARGGSNTVHNVVLSTPGL
jgi:hypothetical protein